MAKDQDTLGVYMGIVAVTNFVSDTETVTRTATSTTVPFEQFTNQAFVRLRGRSFAFKISSSGSGVRWRLGSPRVDFRSDGKR